MIVCSAEETRELLPFHELIEALREMFRTDALAPTRHHHGIPLAGLPEATLLVMPAWNRTGLGGVKIVNVNPGNATMGMPALSASYLVFDVRTGQHLAILDGGEITSRRTAAASALAASYLARADARRLLVVGAGRVASNLADAFRAVRPIEEVAVWNIHGGTAERLAERLNDEGYRARVAQDLEAAAACADIVSCATLATEPLIAGAWLRPGLHLDLIGSFRPGMREADDDAVRRARVYIDTGGALEESGDLIEPIRTGALTAARIAGDLSALCGGSATGRANEQEITLFKSTGSALADLAAATLAHRTLADRQ
ncbi:MAG: ornithine cyclodeaminase family protein [Gammaproteobacteria bacterium]|nr:ornithine cyclodeaminase family protein [Gammaproteobacteria bacterium]MYJ74570.1 ornithine cyclodeaminase family protein [Gammaproteobacteria bacterium]